MNEPKLATARVDSERLVRELLEAFNSLKTATAPLTCSSPREEQQRPPQSQEGSAQALKLVGDALSTESADPRPGPRKPLEALAGTVSDIDERESEQMSACKKSNQHEIIEEFRGDHEFIERLRVTPQELQALTSASLLGSLTCKQDVVFMLRQIREAKKPAGLQATVPPEPLCVPDENIEPSQPDFSEMAERIRCESLAKLTKSDSLRGIDRRSKLRVFSSALVLMAAITWAKLTLPTLSSMVPGARFEKILVSGAILLVASVVVGMYLRPGRSLTQSNRNLVGIWCLLDRFRSRTPLSGISLDSHRVLDRG